MSFQGIDESLPLADVEGAGVREGGSGRGQAMNDNAGIDANEYSRVRKRILSARHLNINRFLVLEGKVSDDGVLDSKTRAVVSLAVAVVIGQQELVEQNVRRCIELRLTVDEILDGLSIAMVNGGVATVPCVGRAVDFLAKEDRSGNAEAFVLSSEPVCQE